MCRVKTCASLDQLRPRHARLHRERGFTLIELLIAVAVIGILASIAVPSYRGYVERANLAEAKSALLHIAGQLERHYTANNSYSGFSPSLSISDGNPYSLNADGTIVEASSFSITLIASERHPDGCGEISVDQLGQQEPKNCW